MSTITISLPKKVAQQIDKEAKKQGFATRSEFIRNLVRKHLVPEEFEFKPFTPRPLEKIEKDFRATGKYNEKFIKSLIRGLSKSSFYEGKTPKSRS